MTSPVEEDDLLAGATAYLQSLPDLVALVGSNERGVYIWQEKPAANFEEEATVGIVVTTSSISFTDEAHTRHFERLGIEIWVGPFRDGMGNIIEPAETRRRLMQVYKLVDKYLNRVAPRTEFWGEIRTHSSERIGNIDRYEPKDGNGVLVGQVFYVVELD